MICTHNAVHELTAIDATALAYDVKGNLTTNILRAAEKPAF